MGFHNRCILAQPRLGTLGVATSGWWRRGALECSNSYSGTQNFGGSTREVAMESARSAALTPASTTWAAPVRHSARPRSHLIRTADQVTVLRLLILFVVLYLVVLRVHPAIPIILLAISLTLDGVDGYLALRQHSDRKLGLIAYARYIIGDPSDSEAIQKARRKIEQRFPLGPRIDIAGDRITEYALWTLFLGLHLIPFYIVLIVIARHSVADGFMAAKGTSSTMRTSIGRTIYASSLARASSVVIKFLTFSYFMLAYILNYPLWVGYVLMAALVSHILLRGAAEVAEGLAESRERRDGDAQYVSEASAIAGAPRAPGISRIDV